VLYVGYVPKYQRSNKSIRSLGFTYKTAAFVWVKKNKVSDSLFWGMGAYTRANAEVCLLGISEKTKAKEIIKSHAVHQIIESKVRKHSEKPHEARDRIVELLGDVSRIELFARQESEGWDCWGNEV
jgi:N6-adenosine-specific RNA methylase IME4